MRKFLFTTAVIGALAFAAPAVQAAETVKATVNGLVCDFCAQGIQKVFGERDEVKNVDVNMSSKLVTIQFKKDATMDDAAVKELIEGNGFTVVEINRSKN